MTGTEPVPDADQDRVQATAAARRAIAALHAEVGPIMFVQSAGCCGGTTPMCYPAGEFLLGDADLLLGMIDGSPFYLDAAHDQAWGHPTLLLDVRPGGPEGFSLAAGEDEHFVTLSGEPSCPRPQTSVGNEPSPTEHQPRKDHQS